MAPRFYDYLIVKWMSLHLLLLLKVKENGEANQITQESQKLEKGKLMTPGEAQKKGSRWCSQQDIVPRSVYRLCIWEFKELLRGIGTGAPFLSHLIFLKRRFTVFRTKYRYYPSAGNRQEKRQTGNSRLYLIAFQLSRHDRVDEIKPYRCAFDTRVQTSWNWRWFTAYAWPISVSLNPADVSKPSASR